MQVHYDLVGVSPLVMHANNVVARGELEEWQKDPANKGKSRAGDDRTPPWTWRSKMYHDGERLAIPTNAIMTCLRKAGTEFIFKKQKSFKEAVVSAMVPMSDFAPLQVGVKDEDGELGGWRDVLISDIAKLPDDAKFEDHVAHARSLGFDLWVHPVNVNGRSHVRVRPRLNVWRACGEMRVAESMIGMDMLTKIFEMAGDMKGLLDGRPSSTKCPLSFGRFAAKLRVVN